MAKDIYKVDIVKSVEEVEKLLNDEEYEVGIVRPIGTTKFLVVRKKESTKFSVKQLERNIKGLAIALHNLAKFNGLSPNDWDVIEKLAGLRK